MSEKILDNPPRVRILSSMLLIILGTTKKTLTQTRLQSLCKMITINFLELWYNI